MEAEVLGPKRRAPGDTEVRQGCVSTRGQRRSRQGSGVGCPSRPGKKLSFFPAQCSLCLAASFPSHYRHE